MSETHIKKPRDNRTHDEKIDALNEAFDRAKLTAKLSGLVNDCSIVKICKTANVPDSYLHSDKLKDDKVNARYHAIKAKINLFRDEFSKSTSNSEITLALRAKEEMKNERDKAQIQFRSSQAQIEGLLAEIKKYDDRIKSQNNSAAEIAFNNLQRKEQSNNQSTIFSEPKIVSPDVHLYKNGQYSFHDINLKDAAWRTCYHQFESLLERQLATRVYIMVGVPRSGKTYWSRESNYYNDRHPVVVDATNLTKSDRSSWLNIIYKYKYKPQHDIKICAVFFNTPLNIIVARNNKESSDKRLSNEDLQEKFNKLEPVDVFEGFDEIIVVQHG